MKKTNNEQKKMKENKQRTKKNERKQKKEKIAFILLSEGYGGTERRIANLFKFLSDRFPGKYHLITNKNLFKMLQKANYELDKYQNIHIIEKRSFLDFKKRAHQGIFVQIGRMATLLKYRRHIKKILKKNNIQTIQAYLEMVPVLGFLPICGVKSIASIVTHLPEYFDKKRKNGWILYHALKNFDRVDALSEYSANATVKMGISSKKVNYPHRNFVNHIQFTPLKKEKIITYTSRGFDWKGNIILLDAISKATHQCKDWKFYIMGKGPTMDKVISEIKKRKITQKVIAGFIPDPSFIVNRSAIHCALEQYDNFTNQSMLEGMASGCAIIATDAGQTRKVVTPNLGILVKYSSESIASTIIKLTNNTKTRTKMGIFAREKILKEHNISTYIDYITKIQDFSKKVNIIDGKEVQ